MCQPPALPHCHVLFWMRREFNSCDDVVHSTHLDYPLSPLHSIISFLFFFLLRLCVHAFVCLCVSDLSVLSRAAGAAQFVFIYLILNSDKWMSHVRVPLDSAASAQAPLNCQPNPKWKQNNTVTSAALVLFFFLSAICFCVFWWAYHTCRGKRSEIPPGRRCRLLD